MPLPSSIVMAVKIISYIYQGIFVPGEADVHYPKEKRGPATAANIP